MKVSNYMYNPYYTTCIQSSVIVIDKTDLLAKSKQNKTKNTMRERL